MALVNVASILPMAVIMASDPPGEGLEPLYSFEIVGERDPSAIGGWGITYDVEDVAYNDFIARHPDFVPSLKLVTQADLDDMASQEDEYGYELGLVPPDEGAAAFERLSISETRAAMDQAGERRRTAEANLRQADMLRKQADALAEGATAEREKAEVDQKAAMDALVAKREAAPPITRAEQHPAEPQPRRRRAPEPPPVPQQAEA